jgi:hypothetical protein
LTWLIWVNYLSNATSGALYATSRTRCFCSNSFAATAFATSYVGSITNTTCCSFQHASLSC